MSLIASTGRKQGWGLVKMMDHGSGKHYFPGYDGNGNVMSLVDGTAGTYAANYEYGPFGETVRASGAMAALNPFRFSTKYQDDETDQYYYGYRYYNPDTGRWLNRDPIEERGGLNVSSFFLNDLNNRTDRLGLLCGSFEIQRKVVNDDIGYEVRYLKDNAKCKCAGRVVIIQARKTKGYGTVIDADPGNRDSGRRPYSDVNKKTKGGVTPIPDFGDRTDETKSPYRNSSEDMESFSDAPDWMGNTRTWYMEVCAICRFGPPGRTTDRLLGCATFEFRQTGPAPGNTQGSRDLFVNGAAAGASSVPVSCAKQGEIFLDAAETWREEGGSESQ